MFSLAAAAFSFSLLAVETGSVINQWYVLEVSQLRTPSPAILQTILGLF